MILKILFTVFVIIWCVVIFIFSNMPGDVSNERSLKVIKKTLNNITHKTIKDNTLDILNTILRKCMHAAVFCVFGILIILCLNSFEIYGLKLLIISIVLAFIYACSDEIHQLFVEGRTSRFTDVLIDTTGASIGVIFIYLLIL